MATIAKGPALAPCWVHVLAKLLSSRLRHLDLHPNDWDNDRLPAHAAAPAGETEPDQDTEDQDTEDTDANPTLDHAHETTGVDTHGTTGVDGTDETVNAGDDTDEMTEGGSTAKEEESDSKEKTQQMIQHCPASNKMSKTT